MAYEPARRRLAMLAVVLLAVLAVTSGCGVRNGSAFDLGEGRMRNCVSMLGYDDGDRAVFGELLLRHEGDQPMTIVAVSLVDAHELALAGAFLVDIGPANSGAVPAMVGVGRTSSLDGSGGLPAAASWESRIEAEGTTVQPGKVWNLVV